EEQSDIIIRRSMLDVRCSTFIFSIFDVHLFNSMFISQNNSQPVTRNPQRAMPFAPCTMRSTLELFNFLTISFSPFIN
ncbi:MAG: hypothetical protein PVH55_12550, partial [Desulfobacterales bacterium]